MPAARRPPPRTPPGQAAEGWSPAARLGLILLVVLGLPLGAALAWAWVDNGGWPGAARSAPQWVTPEPVKGTTGDGSVVRTRVAIDAPEAATRRALQRDPRQIATLLQVSITTLSRPELAGPEGLQQLSDEMTERLNLHLRAEGAAPVRELVIQDFTLSSP